MAPRIPADAGKRQLLLPVRGVLGVESKWAVPDRTNLVTVDLQRRKS
jgi:hypothetical protein